MNICIGGCWHGSKVLKDQKSNYFLAKDKTTGQAVTYERFVVTWKENSHIFWVSNDLNSLEAQDKIKDYLIHSKRSLSY